MKDLVSVISPAIALAPATYSATASGTIVDRKGFESVTLDLMVGVGGITFDDDDSITFSLQDSDDGSTFANVETDDLIGDDAPDSVSDGVILTLNSAHTAATVANIGYIGGKRYLQLVATFSGTHDTGTPIAAEMVLGNPEQFPVD